MSLQLNLQQLPFKTVLQLARDTSGLTLSEISEKTGIHLSQIKRYFAEEEYYPSPVVIPVLCSVLGSLMPIEWQLVKTKELMGEGKLSFSGRVCSRTTRELTDVINTLMESVEDGRLTERERRRVLKEVEEALNALMELRSVLLSIGEEVKR